MDLINVEVEGRGSSVSDREIVLGGFGGRAIRRRDRGKEAVERYFNVCHISESFDRYGSDTHPLSTYGSLSPDYV